MTYTRSPFYYDFHVVLVNKQFSIKQDLSLHNPVKALQMSNYFLCLQPSVLQTSTSRKMSPEHTLAQHLRQQDSLVGNKHQHAENNRFFQTDFKNMTLNDSNVIKIVISSMKFYTCRDPFYTQ